MWCGITLWVLFGSVSSFLPSNKWLSPVPSSPTISPGKKQWFSWGLSFTTDVFVISSMSWLFGLDIFRNKSQMPITPILSSMARTVRYHLGTLAKGSFIITLVKIPRLILTYIHSQLKGKVRCEIIVIIIVIIIFWQCDTSIKTTFLHFSVTGKRLCSLHAEGLCLLFVVSGEVFSLPKPGE